MRQHFRISFRTKAISMFCQHFFQLSVVFDDSIMNYRDRTAAVKMRMSVDIRRASMSSPSSMPDT